MTTSLATLLVQQTKSAIFDTCLAVGESLGLPVTSWREGDPTRSVYWVVSELGETLMRVVAQFCAAGFLDYAEGDWLTLLAAQGFNVEREAATYGSCLGTLTNAGGVSRTIGVGDLTVRNSTTQKTYHNTTGGVVPAGGTLEGVTFEADEAGSESNASVGEIDELVTTVLGLSVANTTAATGLDEQDDAGLRSACREKLGSLSPNGPRDGYAYVAKNADLTGTSGITRCRTFDDSDTGDVLVYLAGPSGAVSGPDLTAATTAILENATPLCITPTIASAVNVAVPVTYSLWVYDSAGLTTDEIEELVEDALAAVFASRPIGGDIIPPDSTGSLYHALLERTILGVSSHAFRVSVSTPAGDTALDNDEVATLGAITPTVYVVASP
jgi:hypothetical protein